MSSPQLLISLFDFNSISDRLLHLALNGNEQKVYQYLDSLRQNINDLEVQLIRQKAQHNSIWDFYPTPQSVIDRMFEFVPFSLNMNVLEPQAGLGHIAIALRNKGVECDCFELSPLLQLALTKMGFRVLGADFLAATPIAVYDLVIANPPFSNLGVMKHTLHAMDFLKPGGRLITLAHHYTLAPSHKDEFFFSWLKTFNAQIIDLGRPFQQGDRKTNIPINLIILDKPAFSSEKKKMIHPLWLSKDWKNASEEDIISALLNAPQHLDPEDIVQIQRYHPQAKTKYLNLFHSGHIPHWCKKINHIS